MIPTINLCPISPGPSTSAFMKGKWPLRILSEDSPDSGGVLREGVCLQLAVHTLIHSSQLHLVSNRARQCCCYPGRFCQKDSLRASKCSFYLHLPSQGTSRATSSPPFFFPSPCPPCPPAVRVSLLARDGLIVRIYRNGHKGKARDTPIYQLRRVPFATPPFFSRYSPEFT